MTNNKTGTFYLKFPPLAQQHIFVKTLAVISSGPVACLLRELVLRQRYIYQKNYATFVDYYREIVTVSWLGRNECLMEYIFV